MIVLTGAAGFLGSNLLLALNRRGRDDVLCVERLDESTKHRNLNRARFLDLVDPEAFLRDWRDATDVRAVVHFGAHVDTTRRDGPQMLENNYRFSVELARWCFARGVPLVYASSATVYGRGRRGFAEQHDCEDPLHLYAFTKFLFDQWIRRNARGAPVVGLRFFNVYGPQEQHKGRMASVVWKFHEQIRTAGSIHVFEGSEDLRRDFVYVDDAVSVALHFLDHPGHSGILNVGTGVARSFMELADLVRRRYDADLRTIPFPEDLWGRYQTFTQADLGALREAGYQAEFISLETGVRRYLDVLDRDGGYRTT